MTLRASAAAGNPDRADPRRLSQSRMGGKVARGHDLREASRLEGALVQAQNSLGDRVIISDRLVARRKRRSEIPVDECFEALSSPSSRPSRLRGSSQFV